MTDARGDAGHGEFVTGDKLVGPPLAHILETEVGGDISLYDPKHERVLVLNGSASDVWLLCDGEQTVDRIVELLATAYGRAQNEIRPDIEATIRQFIQEAFIPVP